MTIGEIVVGFKAQLSKYQSDLQKAQTQTDQATAAMRSAANTVGRAFRTLAVVGVAALGAALGSTIKVTAEFEQAIANAASVSGGSRKELEKLARTLGKETVFSAKEAAEAEYLLASAGLEVIEMAKVLPGVLDLAAGTQTDLASVTDTVLSTLNVFNMEMEETDRVANVFAAAIGNSQATMEKLSTAMSYAGPIASQVGMDIEGLVGILQGLFDAGFKGAQAGTILRGAFTRLLKPSKEAQKVLADKKITLEELEKSLKDPVKLFDLLGKASLTNAEAVTLFGQRALGLNSVIKKGSAALQENIKAVTDTNKANELAKEQLDTFQGSVKLLKSAWQELQITFGKTQFPKLRAYVDQIREAILFISELMEAQEKGSEVARIQVRNVMSIGEAYGATSKKLKQYGSWLDATEKSYQAARKEGDKWGDALTRYNKQIERTRDWLETTGLEFKNTQEFLKAYRAILEENEEAAQGRADAAKKRQEEKAEADAAELERKQAEIVQLGAFEEEAEIARITRVEEMYNQLGMAAEAYNAHLEKLRLQDLLAVKKGIRTRLQNDKAARKEEEKTAEALSKAKMDAEKKAHKFRLELSKIMVNTLVENAFTEKATLGSVAAAGLRAFGSMISKRAAIQAAFYGAQVLAGNLGLIPAAAAMTAIAGAAKFGAEAVASGIEANAKAGSAKYGYGGIAYGPTNAVIGDRAPEIVLPPGLTQDFLAGQRSQNVENNYGGNFINVNVEGADATERGREIADQLDDYFEGLGLQVAREGI